MGWAHSSQPVQNHMPYNSLCMTHLPGIQNTRTGCDCQQSGRGNAVAQLMQQLPVAGCATHRCPQSRRPSAYTQQRLPCLKAAAACNCTRLLCDALLCCVHASPTQHQWARSTTHNRCALLSIVGVDAAQGMRQHCPTACLPGMPT
jgi:hypothetical protein